MRTIKAALIALAVALGASSAAQAQCTGQPGSGLLCGNAGASAGLPAWATVTGMLDRAMGSTQGTTLNRGASVWSATSALSLGRNGGTGGSLTLNGATSGGSVLSVAAAAGTSNFRLPVGNGSSGYVLQTDGSGNTSWVVNASGGTVQSVGLSLPAIFTVSGSPVTATGTLTGSLATQAANLVWAGPSTGAASTPTFRSLVGADLPNPAASTLGGVQSFAAVGSQWINQINTSGVPTASQPAFTDISGTMAAAQCPLPGASSVGCVQSFALQTSKWISSISTLGVPSATQPAFTDISGNLALSQLPSIGNNSVLGNNAGGTAVPSALTASNVLDMVGGTRGQVLYRGASGWATLSPGTSGFVLSSGGAGADPSWIAVAGTGTVTSVAAGTGLSASPSPITTVGTISLASVSDLRVLANVSGGSAAPIANTMTAILDATLGSTQGNLLYRGASNWSVLAPGTNGQVLTQGASTPSWASAGSVSTVSTAGIVTGGPITTSGTININATITPQGRLTLASATPVMTASQAARTTVYYTPYAGNLIPLYDGTNFVPTAFSEVSQATTDTTKSPAAVAASSCYDLFGWSDGGTFRATRGLVWTNTTTRAATLTLVNGIYLNTSSITNGPAAQRGTYLGSMCSNASSSIDFIFGATSSGATAAVLNLWNAYNRVDVDTYVADSATSWTYLTTTNTWRQANGNVAMQATFVRGLSEDGVEGTYFAQTGSQSGTVNCAVGVGLDTTSSASVGPMYVQIGVSPTPLFASYTGTPGIGRHVLAMLELIGSATGCAYYGSGGTTYLQTGLRVKMRM